MKFPLLLATLLISTQVSAQSLGSLFDRRSPSERCTDEVSRHYRPTAEMINGCNQHTSREANRCVDIIIESGSQMHPKTTLICSYQNSKHGIKAMEEFSREYGLSVSTQILFSMVDTQKEAQCVSNLLRATDLNNRHLESCLDETNDQKRQRGIDTIGIATISKSDNQSDGGIMGFIRGLFN